MKQRKNYREFHNQYDDPVHGEATTQDTPAEEGAALSNGPEDY
jgi:hypothetical protein